MPGETTAIDAAAPTAPLATAEETSTTALETTQTAPKANTSAARNAASFCPKCGSPLAEGQLFCGSCGYKLDAAGTTPDTKAKTSSKKSKTGIIVAVAALAIAVIAAFAIFALPSMMATPEDLMTQGDFEAAYAKASGDEEKQDDVELIDEAANLAPVDEDEEEA